MRTLDPRSLVTALWKWPAPAEPLLLPTEMDGTEPIQNAADQQAIIQLYADLVGGDAPLPTFEVDWWSRLAHAGGRFLDHLFDRYGSEACVVVVHVQGPEQAYEEVVTHPAIRRFRHSVVRCSAPPQGGQIATLRALTHHVRLMVREHYGALLAEDPTLSADWPLVQPLMDAFDFPPRILEVVDAWIALQLEPWVERTPALLQAQLFHQVLHQRLRALAPDALILLLGHVTNQVEEALSLLGTERDTVAWRLERAGLVVDRQPLRWAFILRTRRESLTYFEPSAAQLTPAWRDRVRRALAWGGLHRPGQTRVERAMRWIDGGQLNRAEEELEALVSLQSGFAEADRAAYLEACGRVHAAAGRSSDAASYLGEARKIREMITTHWPPPGLRRHFSGLRGRLPGTQHLTEVTCFLSEAGELQVSFRAPRGWAPVQFDLDLSGPDGEVAHLRKCTRQNTHFSSDSIDNVAITATAVQAHIHYRDGDLSTLRRYVAFAGGPEPFAGEDWSASGRRDVIRLEGQSPVIELVGRSCLDMEAEVGWMEIRGGTPEAWDDSIERVRLLLSVGCGQWLKTPLRLDADAAGPLGLVLTSSPQPVRPGRPAIYWSYPGEVGKLLRGGLAATPIAKIGRLVHVYTMVCQETVLETSLILVSTWLESLKHRFGAHIAGYAQDKGFFLRPGTKERWSAEALLQETFSHFQLGTVPSAWTAARNALIHELALPDSMSYRDGSDLREALIGAMRRFFFLQFGFTGLALTDGKWQPFQATLESDPQAK